jgi:hypothetical protein
MGELHRAQCHGHGRLWAIQWCILRRRFRKRKGV